MFVVVQRLAEVDAPQPAVGVHADAHRFRIRSAKRALRELSQVKRDFVPAIIQAQWHSVLEHGGPVLFQVVTGPEAAPDVFAVQYLCVREAGLLIFNRSGNKFRPRRQGLGNYCSYITRIRRCVVYDVSESKIRKILI